MSRFPFKALRILHNNGDETNKHDLFPFFFIKCYHQVKLSNSVFCIFRFSWKLLTSSKICRVLHLSLYVNQLSNRGRFPCFHIVSIASSKHVSWENSKHVCKLETQSRVCITVENSPSFPECLDEAMETRKKVLYIHLIPKWPPFKYSFVFIQISP